MSVELFGVAAVVLVAATIQLTAGFGFGLAAVPALAVVLGAHDAVIVALSLATGTNAFQAWSGRHAAQRTTCVRMLCGAAVGLPIGIAVFVLVDERWLEGVIGLTVLVAVVAIARGVDLRHAGAPLDLTSGLLAGTLTTSTGINGPPLVFALQARRLPPDEFRSTITTVFFTLDVVSVVVFTVAGEMTAAVLAAIAVSIPGQLAGAFLGHRLRRHIDPARFRVLVLVLLAVAGVTAVASALRPR